MTSNLFDIGTVKNLNSPFTEIFSLIIKYEILHNNNVIPAYSQEELKIIRAHMSNPSEMILHGLQDIGALMASVDHKKVKKKFR